MTSVWVSAAAAVSSFQQFAAAAGSRALGHETKVGERLLAASLESALFPFSIYHPRCLFYSIFDRSIFVFKISWNFKKKEMRLKCEKNKTAAGQRVI